MNADSELPAPAELEVAPTPPPPPSTESVAGPGGQHPGEIGVTWEMKGVDTPAPPPPPGHPGEIRVVSVLGDHDPSGGEGLHLER